MTMDSGEGNRTAPVSLVLAAIPAQEFIVVGFMDGNMD
jgi:hypothetical protein